MLPHNAAIIITFKSENIRTKLVKIQETSMHQMHYSSSQVCWCSMNRTFLYIIINYCWWIYYKIKEQKWKDFYHFSSLLVTFLILIQQYHTGVDDDNQEPWLDDSDSGTTLNKITYYPMEKVEFSDFLNIIRKAGSKLRLLNIQEGHFSISKKN